MSSRKHFTTVDAYIQSFPKEVQEPLQLLHKTIKEELPHAEETISYNIPCFKQHGSYVVYFAGYTKHLSLYPFSSKMEKEIEEAANYKMSGKGTIQFPLSKPLPLPFIKKIVQYMLKENEQRQKKSISKNNNK